jgi:Family of unknown function (DUF5946)
MQSLRGSRPQAAAAEQAAYDELQCYTLAHGDPAFIHQYVVDTWTLQHADERTKPIAVAFALIGLYLHLERGATGRQAQLRHMTLARRRRTWPSFPLPRARGAVTAVDVMRAPAGPERDGAIDAWCASVWQAYGECHAAVASLEAGEAGA